MPKGKTNTAKYEKQKVNTRNNKIKRCEKELLRNPGNVSVQKRLEKLRSEK